MFISSLNSENFREFLLYFHPYHGAENKTQQTVSVNLYLPFLLRRSEKLPGHQGVKKAFILPQEGQKFLHKA